MTYDNTNRLALWLNDKREKATHPHLKGQGETTSQVWVSAWFSDEISEDDKKALMGILKRYQSKKPFLSISMTPKENKPQSAPEPRPIDDFDQDDTIPF